VRQSSVASIILCVLIIRGKENEVVGMPLINLSHRRSLKVAYSVWCCLCFMFVNSQWIIIVIILNATDGNSVRKLCFM